ncbi:MAG TPA: hypothetical protein VLQ66_12705 [Paenisporosarcina sp.]|nr:hypothetical protein [Paenisporosarcina sp.]
MIIGFLLILLDIHIFIDVLPNPVGYLLIGVGIVKLGTGGLQAKKAAMTAYIMMVLSLPTVFLSGEVLQHMQSASLGWVLYGFVTSIGDLILVYFVFRMILHEVEYPINQEENQNRVRKMMIIYMSIALSITFLQPFLLNMEQNAAMVLGIMCIVLFLIVHIAFLVLLRVLQKTFPRAS